MVSAWACGPKLVIGQRKVDDKSNEFTAIPELLELLNIKGAIVTIDAMGCQREICKKVEKKEAYYLINLKGNQGKLRKDVERFFDELLKRNIGEDFVTQIETVEADHGRIETRRYTICSDIGWLRARHNWPGLKSIVKTQYTYEIRGKAKQRYDSTYHHSLIAQRKWRGTSATTGKWKIVCIGFWMSPSDKTIAASEQGMRRPILQRSIMPRLTC